MQGRLPCAPYVILCIVTPSGHLRSPAAQALSTQCKAAATGMALLLGFHALASCGGVDLDMLRERELAAVAEAVRLVEVSAQHRAIILEYLAMFRKWWLRWCAWWR